jgi:hypothetical protein
MVQACHDYFTRAAQAEAARLPGGPAALQEQLDALNAFHAWLDGRLRAFRRRFKHARASLLASLDPAALKVFLEDALYQGPLHAEVRRLKTRCILLLHHGAWTLHWNICFSGHGHAVKRNIDGFCICNAVH